MLVAGFVAAASGVVLLACDAEQPGEAGHEAPAAHRGVEIDSGHEGEEEHAGGVRLSDGQMLEFGIEIERAGPGQIETVVELPGEVRPNQDRLAHLVPRYAGIVKEVRKRVGDRVKEGEVLALIESSESLASYGLKSSIDGTVIAKHITRGEAVSTETEAFVVADLDTVWVDLSVYQTDLDRVKVGQAVLISAGHDYAASEARISYVAPVMDERTRTAVARAVLPNPERRWRPGLFVTGRVTVENHRAEVVVPRAALQTLGGETVVFVPDPEGLQSRPVTLGRGDRRHVEILEGLSADDRFVTRGSFTLKSELEKAGFEAGHGH
jgi:cobalt-zinc-cadmium efflux system membrane fusion protein